MKQFIYSTLFLFLIAFVFLNFKKDISEKYYYAYNHKIKLHDNTSKLIATFDTISNVSELDHYLSDVPFVPKTKHLNKSLIIDAGTFQDKKLLLRLLSSNKRVKSISSIYMDDNGFQVGFNDQICIRFKENINQKFKDSLVAAYKLKEVESNEVFDLLSITERSQDPLSIANSIQESGTVVFCHPNLIFERIYCDYIPTDTYFNSQFYLRNTGQVINDGRSGIAGADIDATGAWDFTKGSSTITVAVLDMGVTSNHPDLPNTRQVRLPGSNFFGTNPDDPSPNSSLDSHGNESAGIIAASQDNEGVSGIVPNCKIMPVNTGGLDVTYTDGAKLSSAILFAKNNGADIIYNGWSTSGGYPDQVPVIVDAIINATTLGRNGKGCVVVCVPLNNANRHSGATGYVSFPANVEIAGVLSVGASDRNDQVADYSPGCRWLSYAAPGDYPMFGQWIDVVAPSHKAYASQIAGEGPEVWTMDIPNVDGINPYPADSRFEHPPTIGEQLPNTGPNFLAYTGRFGGTSAAGPQVAGVAALILSINPNLTQLQVFDIIKKTADKVGGYDYNYYIHYNNNQYPSDPGRSREMGYGRLNACRAVIETSNLSISGEHSFCTTSNNYTIPNLLAGPAVQWQVSPQGIVTINSPNSPQTTLTRIGDGEILITATINGYPIQGLNVKVGRPTALEYLTIDGIDPRTTSLCHNQESMLMAYPGIIEPNTTYEWILPNDWVSLQTGTNTCTTSDYILPVYPGSDGTVYVRRLNACGYSDLFSVFVTFDPWCRSYYTISPNPATTNITIDGQKQRKNIKEVRIIQKSGRTMKVVKFSNNVQRVDLNISDLVSDIYYIKIFDGRTWTSKPLMIN